MSIFKPKYYSPKNILSKHCQYNLVIGERSNGKTYAIEKLGIKRYLQDGQTMALIRRWKEDFRGKRGHAMFNALVTNGEVTKYSGGKYNDITYYNGQWFMAYREGEKLIRDAKPFCYGFALSDMEHDKSTSYDCTLIMFDEFLTRTMYLKDEFVLFMNTLSTIIRQRDNVTIFMLANTVNKWSPYIAEMGLTGLKNQKQGTIDVYNYGKSGLRVAVEYCATMGTSKPSDSYFAFNNPHLEMIKSGKWELDIYSHLPVKYKPKDVVFNFFILFDGETLQGEVIQMSDNLFIYVHRKTTDLQYRQTDVIYNGETNLSPQIRYSFVRPVDNIDNKINLLFKARKVFYQSNDVGELVRNFIKQTGGVFA